MYTFERHRSVQRNVRRIARDQLREALADLEDPEVDAHETVHEVRKRCKKIRALLRLTRKAAPELYHRENAALRDAARLVSDARDLTAHLEAVALVRDRFTDAVDADLFERARAAQLRRREKRLSRIGLERRLEEVRVELAGVLRRVRRWSVPESGFDSLRGGLRKTYERAVDAMVAALEDPTSERWHEWRKRTKYHRYHTDLLARMWEPVLDGRENELHTLTDLLGQDHDLYGLRLVLVGEPEWIDDDEATQALVGLLDRLRAGLQEEAELLGRKVFAESPDALVGRYERYWSAWRAEPGSEETPEGSIVPGD